MNCACSGIRSCLLCEKTRDNLAPLRELEAGRAFYQCHECGRIVREELVTSQLDVPLYSCSGPCSSHPVLRATWRGEQEEEGVFEGVTVVKNFISTGEEERISAEIDRWKWVESQSGRLKQDYGPKVNFKRKKLKLGSFTGLPAFSEHLVARMTQTLPQLLHGFTPVEQCHLDYHPARGSAIDPHLDDNWLWGERLVTLNLLSSTVLTFTSPSRRTVIHVPQPRCSLVVVQGAARHCWLHSIARQHIAERRIAVTLRELAPHFREEEEEKGGGIGAQILAVAGTFNGTPSNSSVV